MSGESDLRGSEGSWGREAVSGGNHSWCLGQALVFVWDGALRGRFGFCFSGGFISAGEFLFLAGD